MDLKFTEVITDDYALSEPDDIGNGVTIQFVRSVGMIEGIFWDHGCQYGRTPILFDIPENAHVPADGKWQVENIDPLTLSPSLLCPCGQHGFIRNGRWEHC